MTVKENTAKPIEHRKRMFGEDFFQNFPVVIVAVGHYPKGYGIDLEELFGVKWTGETCPVGKKWMNLHYNQQHTKLLIHTNQLSRYTYGLIDNIALYECPHVAKLAKFKLSRCLNVVSWNSLCTT